MDLVNKQVLHKSFGEGHVIKQDGSYIEISFSSGNKMFVFPDAFEKYLTLTDERAASFVAEILQQKKAKKKEELKCKKELKALERAKRQRLLQQERQETARKTDNIHPSSQSVFWCKQEELDDVFSNWSIFTGTVKSGQKKGQPVKLIRIKDNSACLLTMREADMPEKDRRILGVFMVKENYNGKLNDDGKIPAHGKYRLRLSNEEAEKMLFWNYYYNKNYPNKMTWNSGRQRYFDNIWMAQILRDIISLKNNPQEREFVQDFFEYFCEMNQLNPQEIPKPNGALMRI